MSINAVALCHNRLRFNENHWSSNRAANSVPIGLGDSLKTWRISWRAETDVRLSSRKKNVRLMTNDASPQHNVAIRAIQCSGRLRMTGCYVTTADPHSYERRHHDSRASGI
jgi:hypothetical protein